MSREEQKIVHAYGVVDREVTVSLEVPGLGGAPVLTCVIGPVRVLHSVLDAKRYGEHAWAEHAQDPDWLRDVARRHHAVLQAWSEVSDVLPFRLPSLHAGEAGLKRVMQARMPELTRGLAAIRDQWEWGVKVYLEPSDDSRDAAAGTPAKRPRTGRDYLRGRSRAAAAREDERQLQQAVIQKVHQAFASHTTFAAVNPPLDPALSGRNAPMLLNAWYLAPKAKQKGILRLAKAWGSKVHPLGLRLELTGPWPPYHFAAVSQSRKEQDDERLGD